eukprot:6185490-Pleurochrysis_carterae.AAC.6
MRSGGERRDEGEIRHSRMLCSCMHAPGTPAFSLVPPLASALSLCRSTTFVIRTQPQKQEARSTKEAALLNPCETELQSRRNVKVETRERIAASHNSAFRHVRVAASQLLSSRKRHERVRVARPYSCSSCATVLDDVRIHCTAQYCEHPKS